MYDMPKGHVLQVRVDDHLLDRLDQRRGPASRSDYLRALIENSALVIPDTETGYVPEEQVVEPTTKRTSTSHRTPSGAPHRHRPQPGATGTVTIKGQTYPGYECACGEVITR